MDQPFKQEPIENLDSVVLPLRPPHSALIKNSCKFTMGGGRFGSRRPSIYSHIRPL